MTSPPSHIGSNFSYHASTNSSLTLAQLFIPYTTLVTSLELTIQVPSQLFLMQEFYKIFHLVFCICKRASRSKIIAFRYTKIKTCRMHDLVHWTLLNMYNKISTRKANTTTCCSKSLNPLI